MVSEWQKAKAAAARQSKDEEPELELEDDCGFKFQRKKLRVAGNDTDGGRPVSTETGDSKGSSGGASKPIVGEPRGRRYTSMVVPLAATPPSKSGREADANRPVETAVPSTGMTSGAGTPSKQLLDKRRRRSSFASMALGNKRHSSLGINLQTNLPPKMVPTRDYHQHIMPDLPGPVKMRQLLVWAVQKCAKETRFATMTGLATRLVEALLHNHITTSWYQRRPMDSASSGVLMPNPANQELRECLSLYQQYQDRLTAELEQWQSLATNIRADETVSSEDRETTEPPTLSLAEKAVLQEIFQNDGISKDLDGVSSWLADLPLAVDRLDWTLKLCTEFEQKSKDYCEEVFRQIFARFYAADLDPAGAIEPMAVLRAMSQAKQQQQQSQTTMHVV